MIADVVVAPIVEEHLTDVLPMIHRARLGNNARIMRATRANLAAQLRRAGVPTTNAPDRVLGSDCLLVVHAAARSQLAASIALRHGAHSAWIVTPNGLWRGYDEGVATTTPSVPAVAPTTDTSLAPAARSPSGEAGHQPG